MRIPPRSQRQPLVPPGGIELHLRDMTATFSADLTLEVVQRKLAEHNQWLPVDGDPAATLGHLVETNSTGPLRLGYGAWRDLLLGCQLINGQGELITAGGRTVKNVAGYDLTRFMVGQYGIFGKIVTTTMRTYRQPEGALMATFDPDVKMFNSLLVTPLRPQWSILTTDSLLCGYLGDERTIAFYDAELPQLHPRELKRHTLQKDISLRNRLWTGRGVGAPPTQRFRAAVPPASIARFVAEAQPQSWAADAAFGVVVGSYHPDQREQMTRAAAGAGGSIILLDAESHPMNLASDPSVQALLERLKASFDPDAKLQPLPQVNA